jgi:hypothetical protein
LGEVAAASREMRALLAAVAPDDPVSLALRQRVRRGDQVAWLAAREAYGPRLVELLLDKSTNFGLRPADVAVILTELPVSKA